MAKFYQALQDVSVPRVISKVGTGDDTTYETEGINYPAGSLVQEKDMTPYHAKLAEDGELSHLLAPVDEEQARSLASGGGEPEFGVFIAEHEAEAHALEQYGHVVVPPDQALEAQSAGAEHHRLYQEAVKEHGLDRRIPQEYYARDKDRVPDELLLGGEHRTGLPHNRGPVESNEENDGGERDSPEQATATRPRPGVEQNQNGEEQSDSESSDQGE